MARPINNDHGLLMYADGSCGLVPHLMVIDGKVCEPWGGLIDNVTEAEAEKHNSMLDEALIAGLKTCEFGQYGNFYFNDKKEVRTFTGVVVDDKPMVHGNVVTFKHSRHTFQGVTWPDADGFTFSRIRAEDAPPKSLKKQWEYLDGHFRYSTMNSWNQSSAPAANVKISHLDIPKEVQDTAYDMLSVDNYTTDSGFDAPLDAWQEHWGYSYQWGMNGRSSGYVVIYHGRKEPSGYRSRCFKCGQLNYAKVMENPKKEDKEGQLRKYVLEHNYWQPTVYLGQDDVKSLGLPDDRVIAIVEEVKKEWQRDRVNVTFHNKCGRCGAEARNNFKEPHMQVKSYPGQPVFERVDWVDVNYSEYSIEHAFEVVYSFDYAVKLAVANFIEYCKDHTVEDKEIMVTKTIRVTVEN